MAKKKKSTNIIDTINNAANNVYTSDSYTINTSSTATISYGINVGTYNTMIIPNDNSNYWQTTTYLDYWQTAYPSYDWANPFEKKKKTVFLQEELDI